MRRLIITLVGVLWTLTSFSQYFTNTYNNTDSNGSFVFLEKPLENTNSVSLMAKNCSSGSGCFSIISKDHKGKIIWEKEKPYIISNQNVMVVRNDTIFYTGRQNTFPDSTYYWYFGMITTEGDSIAEYKYKIMNIFDGKLSIYGLTLVGTDEVILWGEGLDNRMPNHTKVPFRSAFLRLGLDGEVRTPLRWWELDTSPARRMTDCATDIDGSLVFSYYYAYFDANTYIIKLDKDNNFTTIGKTKSTSSTPIGFPRVAVDSKGNYFTQGTKDTILREFNFNSNLPFITKFNREGKEIWKKHVPIIVRKPFDDIFSDLLNVTRLSITKDDDVLVSGHCNLADSFYIRSSNAVELRITNIGFIARFDKDGNVKWRHFLAPQMRNGDIQRNAVYDIQEASDGTILVGGYILRDAEPYRTTDSWVMRLSADGCLNDACDHIEKYWHWPDTISTTTTTRLTSLSMYPNPGTSSCSVAIGDEVVLPLTYEVISLDGRRVETGNHASRSDLRLATDALPTGLYVIRMRDAVGSVGEGKWMKVE